MSKPTIQRIGLISESIVVNELLWHGWAPANLNAHIKNAPNVDILAAKGDTKVALQVKASGPTSKSMLQLPSPENGRLFNLKQGPQADFIIFVRLFSLQNYECYIVPVEEAERVARIIGDDWERTLKRDGTKRDPNFKRCIRFELNKNRPEVSNYKEKWAHYRDAWHILEAS